MGKGKSFERQEARPFMAMLVSEEEEED